MTASKAAAYLWYPRDFAADEHVVLMDLETEGAYRRLLDHQWLHGSVPSDLTDLAKICKGVTVPKMRRMWPALSACFQPSADDPNRLCNAKMERVREDWLHVREARSEAGRKGGRPPRQPKQTESKTEANGKLTTPTPTSTPTATPTTTTAAGDGVPYLTRCVMALNAGIRANPAVRGFTEIATSSQSSRVKWESLGIPVETAERVIHDVASRYSPSEFNPYPKSLAYFDKPVREAHERATQPAAVPSAGAKPFKKAPRLA